MRQLVFNPVSTGRMLDLGLLILRVGFSGTLVVLHGYGKIDRFLAGSTKFPDPLGLGSALSLGLAGFAEFVCGLAIVVGLTTRLATIPIIVTMGVAFFVVHAGDPLGDKEVALLYLIGFVSIFCAGPGRISIDALLSKGK